MRFTRNSPIKLSPSFRFGWNNYIQRPGDGSPRNVTLVPGHGIGPEITGKVTFFIIFFLFVFQFF